MGVLTVHTSHQRSHSQIPVRRVAFAAVAPFRMHTANLFRKSVTLIFRHRCIEPVSLFPAPFRALKEAVRIIKSLDFEPAWMELHPREQSLLFQFKKFGCLGTKAAGGSGAAEGDNPFTFRCGMEPVSPADPPRTNQWNHMHLSESMSHFTCQPWREGAKTDHFSFRPSSSQGSDNHVSTV